MKILNSLLIALFIAIFIACDAYDDYTLDTVGYTTVYFPYQELERSAVGGEGLEIKVGAFLGGVRENNNNEQVMFEIDETLLDGTSYALLPSDYYTLENSNTITIPEGEYLGLLQVKFDSLKMANDLMLKDFHYAIPFKITGTTADSILDGKGHTIIPIKLMNTYEGNYYQVGSMKEFFTVSKVLDTAYVYGDYGDLTNRVEIRELSSIMMDTVKINGVANRTGNNYSMKLRINPADNSVTILPDPSSDFQVEENGFSLWDPVKRIFTLKYKYTFNDKDYEVEETLTFRNRIRDGINEWRWPGFEGN